MNNSHDLNRTEEVQRPQFHREMSIYIEAVPETVFRYVADAYLRVTVQTGGPVPNLADLVRHILPNAVEVRVEYPRQEAAPREHPLTTLQPLDQYLAYYRSYHGVEPEANLIEAFNEVLELELEAR